jgi:hypothetical protein
MFFGILAINYKELYNMSRKYPIFRLKTISLQNAKK